MNSFYPAAAAMLAEFCLALLVLSGFLIFSALRSKRRNQAALVQLTEKLKQGEGERLISIKAMLKDIYHIPDDQIDEKSAGIIKTEMLFYQGLMDTFTSRNGAALENLDQTITPVIETYRALVPQANPSAGSDESAAIVGSDLESLKSHMEQLKEKNDRLSHEMNALKTEMDETNSEFTRAFARRTKDNADAAAPTAESTTTEETAQDIPSQTEEEETAPRADTVPEVELEAMAEEPPAELSAESPEEPPALADEATTPEPAAAEENTAPQDEPAPAAELEAIDDSSEDNILKDLDIDLGDLNLDDDDTDENKDAASSTADNETDNTDAPAEKATNTSQDQPPQDDVKVAAKVKTA